jgi:acetyl-CoA acetyltransferase
MEAGWDHRERVAQFLADTVYEEAGIGPDDIHVVQLNDAAAIATPLYLEGLRLAERGEGLKLALDDRSGLGGEMPVNTDGGLLGRGHSLGATGLAMLYELWLQLCAAAGDRQMARPAKTGLLHSHGLGGDNLFILSR